MTARFLLSSGLVMSLGLLALSACGVKTDLDPIPIATTNGAPPTVDQQEAAKRAPDPSKPPHPLGQ